MESLQGYSIFTQSYVTATQNLANKIKLGINFRKLTLVAKLKRSNYGFGFNRTITFVNNIREENANRIQGYIDK